MRKQDRTRDTIFTWKTLAEKKPRMPTGDLHYNEESYNAGNTMSRPLFPCGLQGVYIEWTELTAVKHGNKFANHITRIVGPPGVPTRHIHCVRQAGAGGWSWRLELECCERKILLTGWWLEAGAGGM